jgi:hypothetical protein
MLFTRLSALAILAACGLMSPAPETGGSAGAPTSGES